MAKHLKITQLIKSKYFSKKTNLPCLADDSGLEIDILIKHQVFILQDGVEKIQILVKQLKSL